MDLKKFYFSSFMQDITAFGSIYHFIIIVTALAVFNFYDTAFRLVLGQIILYSISVPVKMFMFKNRPRKMKHANFIEKIEASSFPSVHTMRAFLTSSVLIVTFSNAFFSALLIVISILVAYSRIYLKKHYFADVVAGAIIGAIIGYVVVNYV